MLFSPGTAWLTLRLGIKSLFLHKLRSALTVLGILIGVTAVIWLVAMGEGVSHQAQEQIKSLGATSIIIRSVKPIENVPAEQAGSFFVEYGLKRDDFDRIVATVPTIIDAVPMREFPMKVRYNEQEREIRLVGCTATYFEINQLHRAFGRLLSDHDHETVANVAVIGAQTAEELFQFEDPIGKAIRINDADFYTVIGVTEQRTPSAAIGGSLSGQEYNFDVYIPLSTFRWRIGDQTMQRTAGGRSGEVVELSQITVKVRDLEQVDATVDMIEDILVRHHPRDRKDYAIVVPKELLRQAENLRMLFNVLLILIAGISLLVGGIGIMNIMLATVTERTKEIGIRRALGAKRGHVMWQFLTETLLLTSVGGVLGVFLGLLCGPFVRTVQWMSEGSDIYRSLPPIVRDLQPRVAPWSIIVSILIAVLVGVFFGLYPARRAAMMDPIEALRHE